MATTLTSDQVNYLIWRYLQESGYTYSIYAFQHETKVESLHDQYGPRIKPGSLISLIQRGLQYRELELLINKARSILRIAASPPSQMKTPELTGQFWSLQDGTKKELTDDVEPLFPPISMSAKIMALVGNGRGSMEVGDDDDDERASEATATQQPPSVTNSRKHGRGEDGANGALSGGEKTGVPDKKKRRKLGAPPTPAASTVADRPDGLDGDKTMTDSTAEESPPIEEIRPITNGCSIGVQVETVTEIAPSETTVLTNDEQGVNKVAWSPVEPGKLVSGPRSSTARIWSISSAGSVPPSPIILDHSSTLVKKQEVTAVQWSIDGTMLATGTFDGSTKIWDPEGAPIAVLLGKASPILDLRWNKASTILLSVYLDGGLLAWDVNTGGMLKGYEFVQEVAWVGDETFAVAYNDGDIVVYMARTGEAGTRFKGEEGVGVTSLAWDEYGERLASGDAKGRIAIWRSTKTDPEVVLEAHGSEVSQLLWQPIRVPPQLGGEAQEQPPSLPPPTRFLASRSDTDTTIKLWSFDNSLAISTTSFMPNHQLAHHESSVSKISFSPDGRYLASGSYKKVHIWRVDDGFLEYVYDAIKQENGPLMNGEVNGITETKFHGDVEMGGVDDNPPGVDTDCVRSGLDSFDISDISWDIEGTTVAVAMAGLGCVLVPVKPKIQHQPSPLAVISENRSTLEATVLPATPPSVLNGTHPEQLANGGVGKQTVP